MNGIIDVGGGMRGAYTAGIYDYLTEKGIYADYCLGISAGSANMSNYISGQRGRNMLSYTKYSLRKEYMSVRNFIHSGSYINMDYIYSQLSNSGAENPFDYAAFRSRHTDFIVEATDAETGQAYYFPKSSMQQDNYDVLKASCSLPGICKPYYIDGKAYYDGGISEPIPYRKAFEDGCDRLLILLTRPSAYRRPPLKHAGVMKRALRSFPQTYKALCKRAEKYNKALDELERIPESVLICAPKDIEGMSTLRNNVPAMERLYRMGYADAPKAAEFLIKD